MKWVRLSEWCKQTGDTEDAVHARRRAGIWLEDVHCRKAGDGRIWINTEAARQWVETSSPQAKAGILPAKA